MAVKTYELSDNWGDRLGWYNWKKRRVSGHKERIPHVGDLLRAEMKSDKVAVFRFVKVDPCGQPPDMFFATVEDIGYEGEKCVEEAKVK